MNRAFKYIILFILTLIYASSYSQEKLTFVKIDKQSYNYYLTKKWDSLIIIGNTAIARKIDYYYLRIRLGIAYFETKKYKNATTHFKKALEFNSNDALANEYLWYAYLYSGQEGEAKLLSDSFSKELKEKLKITKSKFIKSVGFDSGYSYNSNYDELKDMIPESVEAFAYERKIQKSQYHNSLFFAFNLSKRLSLTTAYTNLNIESYQWTRIMNSDIYDGIFITNQNQFYTKLNYYNKKKSNVYFAFNYLTVNSHEQALKFNDSVLPPTISVVENEIKSTDYAGIIGIRKTNNLTTHNTFLTYSSIAFFKQMQIGYSFRTYFNNKKNAYFSGQFVLWSEPNPNEMGGRGSRKPTGRLIVEPSFGFRISKAWISGFATIGAIKNYVENDALVINNSSDVIKFRTGATLFIPISHRFTFLAKGLMNIGGGSEIITVTPLNINFNTYSYKSFYVIGSLRYKF